MRRRRGRVGRDLELDGDRRSLFGWKPVRLRGDYDRRSETCARRSASALAMGILTISACRGRQRSLAERKRLARGLRSGAGSLRDAGKSRQNCIAKTIREALRSATSWSADDVVSRDLGNRGCARSMRAKSTLNRQVWRPQTARGEPSPNSTAIHSTQLSVRRAARASRRAALRPNPRSRECPCLAETSRLVMSRP